MPFILSVVCRPMSVVRYAALAEGIAKTAYNDSASWEARSLWATAGSRNSRATRASALR
jgi:hypothetical protein